MDAGRNAPALASIEFPALINYVAARAGALRSASMHPTVFNDSHAEFALTEKAAFGTKGL